ncbi:MAG: GNAT family N-acetyltransferase [Chitinophagaceae bacterium]|nr:GNAT family N-acetyltransferase [Chitinophagaceae bacterium]
MNDPDIFFAEEITLENNSARLTPLKIEDISLLETIAFEPQVWRLGMSNLENTNDLKEYIDVALAERQNKQSYPFLIFDKKTNAVAGSTRYGNISFPHKRLEIGWTWLHPRFHGSGLNKSCKYLLLQYAFEVLQFNRVELKTDLLNQQSQKAMKKIGAKQEGIFRKHQVTSTGRIRDSIFFSITNDEWPDIKQTIFQDLL